MHTFEIWYGYSSAREATAFNILLNKNCTDMKAYRAVVLSRTPIHKWARFTAAPADYLASGVLGKKSFVTCLLQAARLTFKKMKLW